MNYAQNVAILLLLLLSFTLAIESDRRHDQTAAIETRCSSYLSSGSDIGTRSVNLKNELSFSGGDWDQDSGASSPLMPFDDTDSWAWYPPGPEKMVGFDVIDVDPIQHVSNAVHLTGFLTIGIYRNRSLHSDISLETGFSTKPGFSNLAIMFRGFYVENGVERVLCLSGSSKMPSMDLSDNGSRSVLDPDGDRNLVLVLRYPRIFNLTSRAITGEMTSLNERGSSRYFDRVDITSQLRSFSEYSFSKTIRSRVCNDSLFRDEMIENGAIGFNASNVCKIFHELRFIRFSVLPNVDSEKRLGPFVLNREKKDTHHPQEQFELIFETIKCEVEDGSVDTAKISAVVRATPEKTDRETASFRTGISGATMSIEGSWSNKLFCGIGCIEGRCDSQISLYFPRLLSVRQRNIVLGTISSNIGNRSDAYYYSPLTFNFLAQPSSLMNYTMMPCRYNYSKIKFAQQLRDRRNREFSFTRTIKKSILTYPSMEQLSFRSYVIAVRPHYAGRFMVQMEVLSLGPRCGNYSNYAMNGIDDIIDSQGLVNVAIHLKFIDEPHFTYQGNYEIVTNMFFEGLYDKSVGEMHLTGCAGNTKLMDCSIEARLDYSPSNIRWFKQPIVNISVTSQRNVTDPLRFTPIRLKSYVIGADDRKDVPFRVIILSLDIVIVLSQFEYMNKNPNERTPRISLVMLGIQILGYIAPIMTGSEIALKSITSRFLLLAAISLMLNLIRRVILSRRSAENSTNDIEILRKTLATYIVGFVVFVAPKIRGTIESPPWPMMLEMYFAIIQITFVLPQLIANFVSKNPELPVRRIYIAWFLMSRIFPLYYGIPVPNATSWEIEDMSKANQEQLVYAGDTLLSVVMYVGLTVIFVCRVWRRITRKTTSIQL